MLEGITCTAPSQLSQALSKELSSRHNVRLTDRKPASSGQDYISCSLDYDDAIKELVSGIDVIVHSGEVDADASASDQLGEAMRCTYNLLWAANVIRIFMLDF